MPGLGLDRRQASARNLESHLAGSRYSRLAGEHDPRIVVLYCHKGEIWRQLTFVRRRRSELGTVPSSAPCRLGLFKETPEDIEGLVLGSRTCVRGVRRKERAVPTRRRTTYLRPEFFFYFNSIVYEN